MKRTQLKFHSALRTFCTDEIFYIQCCPDMQPLATTDHLVCGYCDGGPEFFILSTLVHLNLNRHEVTILDTLVLAKVIQEASIGKWNQKERK